MEDEPPVVLRQPQRLSNGGYHDAPMNQGDNSSSDGSGGMYRERSRPVSTVSVIDSLSLYLAAKALFRFRHHTLK